MVLAKRKITSRVLNKRKIAASLTIASPPLGARSGCGVLMVAGSTPPLLILMLMMIFMFTMTLMTRMQKVASSTSPLLSRAARPPLALLGCGEEGVEVDRLHIEDTTIYMYLRPQLGEYENISQILGVSAASCSSPMTVYVGCKG